LPGTKVGGDQVVILRINRQIVEAFAGWSRKIELRDFLESLSWPLSLGPWCERDDRYNCRE
jgi:hypothetical protein